MTASAVMESVATAESNGVDLDARSKADGPFELIHGRWVEKQMGWEANWVAGRVAHLLNSYLDENPAGEVIPEQSFQCFPDDPGGIRKPDVAFVAANRVPAELPTGHIPIAPDLAVEIVSPNDNAYEVESRLADYRSAGVRLVWFLFPNVRTVRVYPLGGSPVELGVGDHLTGGAVLPGFSVPVVGLFRSRRQDTSIR